MSMHVVHSGGCHCGGVRFQFEGTPDQLAWDCNCSICSMKRNTHIMVSKEHFKVLQGEELLTCYQFETKVARHLFCKVCGICPFYVPRSNPDAFAVTLYCIAPGSLGNVTIKHFDGQHWEESYKATGIGSVLKSGQAS